MLIQLSNLPDGETVLTQMNEEQVDLLKYLKENGAFIPGFSFEEVVIKYFC